MNRLFVRDLSIVAFVIALVTTVALGFAPRSEAPQPGYHVSGTTTSDPVKRGAQLYVLKGCVSCHSIDGSPRVGPTFLHDYGTQVPLTTGETVMMDEAYIRESLRAPRAKARPGYPPSMPTFDDAILKARDASALVAYLVSLR